MQTEKSDTCFCIFMFCTFIIFMFLLIFDILYFDHLHILSVMQCLITIRPCTNKGSMMISVVVSPLMVVSCIVFWRVQFHVGEITQGRCFYTHSFSPLWTGFRIFLVCLFYCSRCRGDSQGRDVYYFNSRSPLSVRNSFFWLLFFNYMSGRFTGEW